MRLIDADKFDRQLAAAEFNAALLEADDRDRPYVHQAMYYSTQSFRDVMKMQPTVDATPVVHGQWIDINPNVLLDPRMYCSVCKSVEHPLIKWNYCPHCGAKMDENNDILGVK